MNELQVSFENPRQLAENTRIKLDVNDQGMLASNIPRNPSDNSLSSLISLDKSFGHITLSIENVDLGIKLDGLDCGKVAGVIVPKNVQVIIIV